MKTRVLAVLLLCFSSGVLLHIYSSVTLLQAIIFTGGIFVLACIVYFSKLLFITLALIFFLLGFLRVELFVLSKNTAQFHVLVDQKVTIVGIVNDEPDLRETNVRFPVLVSKINDMDVAKPFLVLVSTDPLLRVSYGDALNASGTLRVPEAFFTDQGTVFDYKTYLQKDGVDFLLPQAKVVIESHGKGSHIRAFLFHIKEKIIQGFDRSLPVPENALLGGLVLGAKSAIPNDLRNDFVRTGTIHIVALSGYNVTIVALFCMKLLRTFFSELVSLYAGIIAIILFAIMTGAGATVVRASVMAIIALLARRSGREFDAGRALVIAVFFMILHNPLVLPYDISFQLSCLATLGLIYITPITIRWFKKLPARFGIRELVAATVATNISVIPFIVYKMGIVSLITLPANLLILPIIPATMLFGFFGGVFSLLSVIIAYPLIFLSHLFLSYEIHTIHLLSQIPFAAVTISDAPALLIVLVYGAIIFWVFYFHTRSR